MDQDVLKRLEELEKEVRTLKAEVAKLEKASRKEHEIKEKPLTKFFFPEKSEAYRKKHAADMELNTVGETAELNFETTKLKKNIQESAASMAETAAINETAANENIASTAPLEEKATIASVSTATTPSKPKQSFDQMFFNALPKVFMVILILGVLWGLKLASDYGYLSDAVKIIGGYAISLVLLVAAIRLDKKNSLSEPLVISLYGGAYIVGILTTAAGAIMYDVLGLNVALIIAIIYIAYGIGISYMKKNEVLTIFVSMTSLLLPYLLDYMDFNIFFIAGYIVIVSIAQLFVIAAHKQRYALYVSTFFATLALTILGNMNRTDADLLTGSILVLFAAYLGMWHYLNEKVEPTQTDEPKLNSSKLKPSTIQALHYCLLFIFNVNVLIMVITMFDYLPNWPLYCLLAIQAVFSFILWKSKEETAFSVLASTIALTATAIIFNVDLRFKTSLLFVLLVGTFGMFLALKLRLGLMKFVYAHVFFYALLAIYLSQNIDKFLSIENLMLLLVPILLTFLYVYAIRPKEGETRYENYMKKIRFLHIIPVVIFIVSFSYVTKLEDYYPVFTMTEYGFNYNVLSTLVLAFMIAVAIAIPKKWGGKLLASFALLLFAYMSLQVHFDSFGFSGVFGELVLLRIIYFFVLVAIYVDIWQKGLIYEYYGKLLKPYIDWVVIAFTLIATFIIFGNTDFFEAHGKISENIAVMLNTITIFIAAIFGLFVGTKHHWKTVRNCGIVMLIFGIVKMIFFDLTNLDILIRSILFIVIGAVGLVLSNKFMKKGVE